MKKLIFAVTALALSTAQAGVVIHVDVANCPAPGNGSEAEPYCSIQTAIDNAVDTDEIVVAPGTYFETINFIGKAVWLHSSGGADVTIIDATDLFSSVVTCESGEGPDTVLSGFVITGGTGTDFYGGGMLNISSSPTVTNCTFSGNTALFFGGGMYNVTASSPTVTNCTFSGNIAGEGGGMFNFNSSPSVIDCTFTDNGAFSGGGMTNDNSDPTVVNCRFIGNSGSSDGGGMRNADNSSPIVINCTFSGNHCSHDAGGMSNRSSSTSTIVNCTFDGNHAGQSGGAMKNQSSTAVTVTNSILWNNTPNQISGSTTVVTYSDVQGGWSGTGNIDADPMFVDPDNEDFRLAAGSPGIDAADNTAVPDDITTDLDGNPRFLEIPETPDTGNGTLPIVDMGAYESLGGGCFAVTSQEVVCHADGTTFTVNIEGLNACTGGTTQVTFTASGGALGQELCFTAIVNDGGFCCSTEICVTIPDCTPAALPSDLDGDGIVGIADFLALLAAWGSCPDCGSCPADFDGNCSVGILDLLILLGNWS